MSSASPPSPAGGRPSGRSGRSNRSGRSSRSASTGVMVLDDEQEQALRHYVPSSSSNNAPRRSSGRYGNANLDGGSGKPSSDWADRTVSRSTDNSSPRTVNLASRQRHDSDRTGDFVQNDTQSLESAVGLGSSEVPSEYSLLRTSNPFSPIQERESVDAILAFTGARAAVKVSVPYILIGAAVGVGLGILLSQLKVSSLVADWVALPGSLFLRALKSLVVPYVFCSVAVAIGDIVFVGKGSAVGLQTLKIFVTETTTSTAAGLAVALLFRPFFRPDASYEATVQNAMGIVCSNGLALNMQDDGTLDCFGDANASLTTNSKFHIDDVTGVFETSDSTVDTTIGLSEQLISILTTIVPNNLFSAMYNVELLSVITFAMVMGAIAGRNFFTKTRRVNYLYMVLLQLRNTFFLAIEWVIWATPFAIIFIIAGSFASNQESLSKISEVYMYIIAAFCGMIVQMFMVVPAVYFLFTRCNPYSHMKHMVRAYVFAFCSASSLATAPITLGCIQKARVSSTSLSNFVVSIGVVANMSGAGWYYPIGLVFLAESSGNGDQLTVLRFIAIYFLTLVGCTGTPPIPSGGIALMSTIYQTVFGVNELPSTWALYVAMDIFADRIATVCNVNDDIMALKVIAENTDETVAANHLGQRE
jgi:Na+/H+-dicarboxylate symporter